MKKTLIVQAPAKINIALWVKEKRPDGYHELESIMQSISLSDTLTIQEVKESGLFIECNHPAVPTGPENLVHKAAMVLLERWNIPPHLHIRIEKKIPVAAGLGGGSSDAAAILGGIARLYDKPMALPDLLEIAAGIGSDVPFLLHGGLALATGRGEKLTYAEPPRPPLVVVIANPKGVQVSTKWAYQNYTPGDNARKEERFKQVLQAYRRRDLDTLKRVTFNDLENVTLQGYPEVARIKEAMKKEPTGLVLMSGSGPTVFGLYHERKAAVQAISMLDQNKVNVFLEHTTRTPVK